MLVERIKQVSSNKYEIKFKNNEKITLSSTTILNNNLLFKKDIDDDLLKKLEKEDEYYVLYDKVIKMLGNKRKCEYEIRKYLEKNKLSHKNIDKMINSLKEKKLIDDVSYVKAYINDKINLSSDGPLKIKRDLLTSNIDENIIDEELAKVDDSIILDKLEKLIEKKISLNKKDSIYILKQKIANEFVNKGYYKETILDILESININDEDVLEKEFNKLYNKYKIKYQSNELETFVKGKLYKKGFSLENINEVLSKYL